MLLCRLLLSCLLSLVLSETLVPARHIHNGTLQPFTGKSLSIAVSLAEDAQLERGETVVSDVRSGRTGTAVVIQDIHAPPTTCLRKLTDFIEYKNMVPHCQNVKVYDRTEFNNGTVKTKAEFDYRVMGVKLGYFLSLTQEPKHPIVTWTLDYDRSSDLDDSVGQWELLAHPKKSGWTRAFFSTKVQLFPWVPEFLIRKLTKGLLLETTTWLKKEAEKEQKQEDLSAAPSIVDRPDAVVVQQADPSRWKSMPTFGRMFHSKRGGYVK